MKYEYAFRGKSIRKRGAEKDKTKLTQPTHEIIIYGSEQSFSCAYFSPDKVVHIDIAF